MNDFRTRQSGILLIPFARSFIKFPIYAKTLFAQLEGIYIQ